MTEDNAQKLYTVRMVAEMMLVTPGTVRDWYKTGKLKVRKINGRTIRITESDLAEFVRVRYEADDHKTPGAATDLI